MADQQSISQRTLPGRRLSRGEIRDLFGRGRLSDLAQAARSQRQRCTKPTIATYSLDRPIRYTNVCVYSGAGALGGVSGLVQPGDREAYLLRPDELIPLAAEAVASGATGVELRGGVNPELRLGQYVEMLKNLRSRFPFLHLQAFSTAEVWHVAQEDRVPVSAAIGRLKEAGLGSIPGGGPESLANAAEDPRRPGQPGAGECLEVHHEAHRQGVPTTARMLIGAGESLYDRACHLCSLRELQDETGGLVSFGLDVAGHRAAGEGADRHDVDVEEYLRALAVSRIALDNVRHIQGAWWAHGNAVAGQALLHGADDLGMLAPAADVAFDPGPGAEVSQVEAERVIRSAGLAPRQRRALFEPI